MSSARNKNTSRLAGGAPLLIAAAVLWSFNGLFIRTLNNSGLGGWTIAGYRSLFACLFLTPFVLRRIGHIDEVKWVVGAVLSFTAMCATFVNAITQTTVANAVVLQYTAPVWVFVLSPWITRERATGAQWLSLAISVMGIAVIFGWQFELEPVGLVLGLAAGVVFGIQTVLFRRVRAVDPLVLVWMVCGGSAVLLLPVAYTVGRPPLTPPLVGWLALMGLVQFAIPYVLYSAGLRRVSAQKGALLILLEPVLSPFWVWLAVSEVPHVSTLIGGGCILSSVIYVTLLDLVRGARYAVSADA